MTVIVVDFDFDFDFGLSKPLSKSKSTTITVMVFAHCMIYWEYTGLYQIDMADGPARYLFINAQLHRTTGAAQRGWLLTDGAVIAALDAGNAPATPDATVIDLADGHLLPGFIDVHVHGAAGFDTMDDDADALPAMAAFYARHGVTAFLPTTWSATHADILAALQRIAHAAAQPASPDGARIIGAHLEGPYLNPTYCGAQDARLIRRAAPAEFSQYLETGVIRLASLAPEFDENLAFLDACVQHGITGSIAHTGATYAQTRVAVAHGLRHSTHTYNAMHAFGHREPGALGAVLTSPEISCELIADGIHVHPAAMQLLAQAKGVERVILITDAMRATGMPEGQYAVDDRMVDVHDGSARLHDGTLAGSVLTMDAALRNFMTATGLPLEQVWPATSLNAARAVHADAHKGSLAAGKDADLVWLDADLNVAMTVVEGRIVYRRQA